MSEVDEVESPANDEAEVDTRTKREKIRDFFRRVSFFTLFALLMPMIVTFAAHFGLTYVQMYSLLTLSIVAAILSTKE